MGSVGTSVARKEGMARATGAALYADDLRFPGLLHGRTVRSSIARGRLAGYTLGFDPAGFTVVDHRDIPGVNCIALIERDQPCLVADEIRHAAEPVLLLAHEDRDTLFAAPVTLREEAARPNFDAAASEHVFKHIVIEKGQLEKGFALADTVVEGTYSTGAQEHVYIEPNVVIAVPEGDGVALHGSMQCPYYVLKALRVLLGDSVRDLRVVQSETGGGFGGKEEYPSMIAAHACLLARKSGRPVKILYDRSEDMIATTKRHPSIVRHRTGVTRHGRLTAMEIEVLMDGGAYCTLSPVVLSRGVIHSAGPYRCKHTRIEGRVVRTDTPPNGAFRGFGAPQTQFALEVHMERIAETLGLDPLTVRLRNAVKPGDTTATGQTLGPETSAVQVLREAARRSGYRRRRARLAGTGRGIGLSLFYHGAGFTGSGEVMLASRAGLETTPEGVRILVANTEIGQGTRTMLAQIVADALEIPYDQVDVAPQDTSLVPDSGPTVASRTCMVVGGLLERCARRMREQLAGAAPAEHHARAGRLHVEERYSPPPGREWNDATYQGDAYATFGWGCDVAEVELDPVTHEARVTRFTAVQEFGRPIHPAMARGQIEGGTAQGLGWALLEDVVMRDGLMANAQLTNYVIPTTLDTPAIDVVMLENHYPGGPFGAKGVGEMPIDGPAPAVVNAIRHAGLDVRAIPATPERLQRAPRLAPRPAADAPELAPLDGGPQDAGDDSAR